MAKLVEILARDWKNWPVEAWLPISQDAEGKLFVSCRFTENGETRQLGIEVELSDNLEDDVTRAQWEAERARIAREEVCFAPSDSVDPIKINRSAEEQELADIACGKRSKEDQALWDQVAMDQFRDFMQSERGQHFSLNQCDYARLAAEAADAFMVERAKRLKGV